MRAAGGASGAWVYDGGSGSTVFKWHAAQRRVPASVQKLVTTATALDRLGAEARFETAVLADGEVAEGTLDGEPLPARLRRPDVRDEARSTGSRDAVADTGLEQSTAGSSATRASSTAGAAARPAGSGPRPTSGPLSALAFNRGSLLPFGRGWQSNPPAFAAERLRVSLRREEVDVRAAGPHGATRPRRRRPSRRVESPPLGSIVRHTNQVSDNYYAEMLLKGVGARSGGAGSTSAGARVARAYAREAGFSAKIVDGSGLSRGNLRRAARRRPPAAARAHAAVVRGVLPLAARWRE